MLHKIIVHQKYRTCYTAHTYVVWKHFWVMMHANYFIVFFKADSLLERINLVKWISLPSPNRMKLLVFGCIKLPQQFGGPTAQTSAFLAYSYLLRAAGPKRLNISHSLFTDTQAHAHSTRELFNLFVLLKFGINLENSVHLWNLQYFLLIIYSEKI